MSTSDFVTGAVSIAPGARATPRAQASEGGIALVLHDLRGGGAERACLRLAGGMAAAGRLIDLVLVKGEGSYLADVPPGVRLTVLDRSRVSRAMVGLPVIATIPQIAHADPAAYVVKRPLSDFAESIRNLRTSLFLSRNGAPPKIVAMMSALPHEGKTTTTLALGRQCAESGARVLVIDADMRRRALTAHLNAPVSKGLVELVEGRAPLESCLYRDPLSNAMILPIARGDTGKDVFFAHDLGRVFDMLRGHFDIILLDTAPLLPLAEPRVVASHADAIVLLTHWHKTSQSAMQDAAKLIRTLDVPIAGVALTCADMKILDSFGYAARSYGQRAGYARYYVQ